MTAILQILASPRPLSFGRRVAGDIRGRTAAARPELIDCRT